jgi:Fe-S oxidoreductase
MFSENAKSQIDACRFCWMCRHVCPVGLATGKEADTPRGRAVLCKYVLTGMDIQKEITGDMFACCLCNNCASWCETGYRPEVFIREARTEALVTDTVPPAVKPVVDRVLETGTIYEAFGEPALPELPAKAKVLLILGETVRAKQPKLAVAAASLLKKAGADFTVLKNEPPTGAMMYDLVGEIQETRDVAAKLIAAAKETGADAWICLDPTDARFLKQDCPRWGLDTGAEVYTITAYLAEQVKAGALKVKKPCTAAVTFHDPCRLARDLEETEPARDLLKACGAELKEMFLNRDQGRCCGGEVMTSHSPQVTALIAATRLDDAKRTGAEVCITACPGCSQVLGAQGGDFVKNILELLDECC